MAVIISLHNETDGTRHNNYFSAEDCTGRAMYVMHFHVRYMLHAHGVCPCSMSKYPVLHVHVSMLHSIMYDHVACQCCVSMLHVYVACLCGMSMLRVHAVCPSCMNHTPCVSKKNKTHNEGFAPHAPAKSTISNIHHITYCKNRS
jgi:hypothetical protein